MFLGQPSCKSRFYSLGEKPDPWSSMVLRLLPYQLFFRKWVMDYMPFLGATQLLSSFLLLVGGSVGGPGVALRFKKLWEFYC